MEGDKQSHKKKKRVVVEHEKQWSEKHNEITSSQKLISSPTD